MTDELLTERTYEVMNLERERGKRTNADKTYPACIECYNCGKKDTIVVPWGVPIFRCNHECSKCGCKKSDIGPPLSWEPR